MQNKLKNYTAHKIVLKRSIKFPYKKAAALYGFFLVVLILFSAFNYWNVYLNKNQVDKQKVLRSGILAEVRNRLGVGVYGQMKPQILKSKNGFYSYFKYLTKNKVEQTWLEKINIENGKLLEVELKGKTENPDGLHYLLSYLTANGPFSKLPLHISEVTSLDRTKSTESKRRNKKAKEKKIKLRSIYSFVISSKKDAGDKKGKKSRRRRR